MRYAVTSAFFVRGNGKNRRFTKGKSRVLQAADGGNGIVSAAAEWYGIALRHGQHIPAPAGGHAPIGIGNETFSTSHWVIVQKVSFLGSLSNVGVSRIRNL